MGSGNQYLSVHFIRIARRISKKPLRRTEGAVYRHGYATVDCALVLRMPGAPVAVHVRAGRMQVGIGMKAVHPVWMDAAQTGKAVMRRRTTFVFRLVAVTPIVGPGDAVQKGDEHRAVRMRSSERSRAVGRPNAGKQNNAV